MALADKKDYIVARDATEAERLNHSHTLMLQCQGYHLHPDIVLDKGARVADLATGTAIWLREVAEIDPSLECHGFDISDIMYPKELPSNVKLHLQDLKKPFDSQWHGYFDAVHLRFLQAALAREDWAVVLKNIVQILKPSGWLQWGEVDSGGMLDFAPRPMPPDATLEPPYYRSSKTAWRPPRNTAFRQVVKGVIGNERLEHMAYGYKNLENLYADPSVGNLDNVFADMYATDSMTSMNKEFSQMLVKGFGGMMRVAEQNGKLPFDWEEMKSKALREIDQGAYIGMRMSNFIGRKKL